ncbi:MAG: HNH endonuclease signature motif containing protein [Prolixibacteraceae bacterium]
MKKYYYSHGAEFMTRLLNRSKRSVYSRAKILGLSGVFVVKFTEEQIKFIKENYSTMSNTEIGAIIGRSKWSVKAFASSYGLKRSAEESQNIQERCRCKTNFVKGHLPKNTKSDFDITIRTSHCGSFYKWIRLSVANWAMLHVYNWEQANGTVPEGKILRSISGDTLDCSPENWKLVDRAEHLTLNSGRSALEDKYIANILTIRSKEMKPIYLQMPELLDLKRNELKLRRTINELAETSKTN